MQKTRPTIGWREWVSLPELRVARIKAKVDTGARTSSLHAYDIHQFIRGKKRMVRFKVHPVQRNSKEVVEAVAPLKEVRLVRPSSGHAEERPVILTELVMMGERWEVELTLTSRDAMGFRMLLGRQAIRRRFVVDPGCSFLGTRDQGLLVRKRRAPRRKQG